MQSLTSITEQCRNRQQPTIDHRQSAAHAISWLHNDWLHTINQLHTQSAIGSMQLIGSTRAIVRFHMQLISSTLNWLHTQSAPHAIDRIGMLHNASSKHNQHNPQRNRFHNAIGSTTLHNRHTPQCHTQHTPL
jgi:hypothetical protein